MKRPNILFALADDASHFGVYGHSFVNTPNIDHVASEGVLFENAFTVNPKCAPSRACILTGRYTWELEDACNHLCYFPDKFDLYPDLLEESGYFIGYTGVGWKPGDWRRSGLKRNPAGNMFNNYRLTPPENTKIQAFDYAANFEDFLSKKPSDQPFYFWYGGSEPHRPYSFGEGIRAGKSISDIEKVPDYWPDCDEVRIDMLDYAYEMEWFDKHLGLMLKKLEEIGELDNTLVVVTSDNGCAFPRVKGQMYEQDFHLPMVAQWNDRIKKKGRRVSDLINFVDLGPTFLEAAGAKPCKTMSGNSFLDVFSTEEEGQIDSSRNVAYFGREKHDPGREYDVGYPVRCIRNHQFLYVRNFAPDRWPAGNPETGYTNCDYSPTRRKVLELHDQGDDYYYNLAFGKRPMEELYDIVDDPQCMKNLACVPQYQDIKASMWKQLEAFLIESKDPRLLVSSDYFDKMETIADGANFTWKGYEEGRWELAGFLRHDWELIETGD